ncbi:MAG: hypothetical protein EZS28_019974, partial [Streblomastix strix]
IRSMGLPFSKQSTIPVKHKPVELALPENFDKPKINARTPTATAVEQQDPRKEIGKFLQSQYQLTLQDIERQLTPGQSISEKTQAHLAKALTAITVMRTSEIDFRARKLSRLQNFEARRRDIQCPPLLSITTVMQPIEVLDSKRCPIDKILQSEQTLALNNFPIDEEILAHFSEQQEYQFANDVLSQMILTLGKAERTHFTRAHNENGTNINYFYLAANSFNSNLNSETRSHMLGTQVIARRGTVNKDATGITNLLFGIQQLGKADVKTQRFRRLTPSPIWKQIMRPIMNQNENQAFELNQEIQNYNVFKISDNYSNSQLYLY